MTAARRAKAWYSITAQAGGGTAELFIYDTIDGGSITARKFIADLAALGSRPVRLRINSPGGDVFDGLAIYNALRAYPGEVTVSIEGIAASIASVIAMAGKTIRAAGNSFLMLHDPHAFCLGTAADMTAMANLLTKIKGSLVATYRRSGKGDRTIEAWMGAETWFTAVEAQAAGLVDAVDAPIEAVARFDLSSFGFKHPLPAALAAPTAAAAWDRALSRLPGNHGGSPALLSRPAIPAPRR